MKFSPSRHLPQIVATLLGAAFIFFGLNYFGKWVSPGGKPEIDSAKWHFFQAFAMKSSYFAWVKIMEIVGGILLLIPFTRNWGLLIIGPIVVNILAYQIFLTPAGEVMSKLLDPTLLFVSFASAYLLFVGRKQFLALLNPNR